MQNSDFLIGKTISQKVGNTDTLGTFDLLFKVAHFASNEYVLLIQQSLTKLVVKWRYQSLPLTY
jgi:hypothetical protein